MSVFTRILRRATASEDAGVGLILVIGIMTIVTALMIVGTTMADRSLQSSRTHVSFEGSLAAAENGLDVALAHSQSTYDSLGTDSYLYPATANPSCPVATPDWNAAGAPGTAGSPTAQEAAEAGWAKSVLLSIAVTPSCRTHSSQGDYVFFKPLNHQTVYSMAWSPSYGANEVRMRYLKAEYLFTPFAPSHAILTGGNLALNSSTLVTAAPPNDPSVAAVHTNGSLTVSNGNPTVYGPVTQSGSGTLASSNKFYDNTGGNVTLTVKQAIPTVSALSIWGRQHTASYAGGWYDLCPDGSVRSPNGASPCLGTQVGSNSYRGWTFDGSGTVPKWSAGSAVMQNGYSGVYFVYGGDVVSNASNSGGPVPNLTVLAAASTVTCNKVGGNISWDHIDLAAPAIPNLFMVADQDLQTGSNFSAGGSSGGTVVSGFFVAGDQVQMETSSAGAYGAVVASDACDPQDGQSLVDSNVIKNPSIYYDPNGQAPFTDIVNTTLWLELTG